MTTLAVIALGGNLGDRKAILDRAIAAMAGTEGIVVRRVSTYHETAPVGGPSGQGAFLNAAVAVETSLHPQALHAALRAIEAEAGRVRKVRWDARTLDLDLVLFGDTVLETPALMVPHPRMAVRRFVLAPAAEVAPEAVDPITGRTLSQLLAHLDRRPSYVAIEAPPGPNRTALFDRLVAGLVAVGLRQAVVPPTPGEGPSEAAYLADVQRRVDTLATHRWPPSERWMVSDFCLELECGRFAPRSRTAPAELDSDASRAWGNRSPLDVLTPTFAVVLSGENRPSRVPGLAPFPILWIEAASHEALVAEILAACAASRP